MMIRLYLRGERVGRDVVTKSVDVRETVSRACVR